MKNYTNELSHMTNMAAMPIYGKNLKNYGHIGLCMVKSENYLFFRSCCSLRSQSCLKHSAK